MAEASPPARLWYQSFVHPVEQAPYIERLQALLQSAAAPGIGFEVHGLDPPDHLFHPLTEFRCAAQTIRNALEAERAGYDAFVIGHFQDPGLLEVRGAVDTPVIGLGEATMLAALSMGRRLRPGHHRSDIHRLARAAGDGVRLPPTRSGSASHSGGPAWLHARIHRRRKLRTRPRA